MFQANAIGRGAKSVREFLEKNYTDDAIETDDLTIKLVIKALLEVSAHGNPGRVGAVGQESCGASCVGDWVFAKVRELGCKWLGTQYWSQWPLLSRLE